jgi:hypothetical protein
VIFDPAAMDRMLQRAERVTLRRGETQTVVVPVLDPTR